MLAILATLPILAILVLMVGLRWSAARAGGTGLLLAWLAFGYGTRVLPALCIHELQSRTGALEALVLVTRLVTPLQRPTGLAGVHLSGHEKAARKRPFRVTRYGRRAVPGDQFTTAMVLG